MQTFPPYADGRDDDHFQFGAPMSHQMHRTFDGSWVPIDPALYNMQFEQQRKQLNFGFPQFHQQSTTYQASIPHNPSNSASIGQAHIWNPHIDAYRNLRYDSPGGHLGGSMSEASSDYAVSPEIARQQITFSPAANYVSPSTEAHFSQHSWNSNRSFVMTPTSTPTNILTPSIALKELDLQDNSDYHFELQEDDLRTQLPIHAPEELELSDSVATLTTSSQANTTSSTRSACGSDSSVSSPARDHDSDSDFDPKRRAHRMSVNARISNNRPTRRLSSSSYPTLDINNRVHKQQGPRLNSSKEKSKPRPVTQLNAQPNSNNKVPKSFPCSFHAFGCSSTFANKNEWKRHVTSQHLQLGFYRCDLGTCNPDNNIRAQPYRQHNIARGNRGRGHNKRRSVSSSIPQMPRDDDTEQVVVYNDFNRKDLFTQHCRRMHGPARHLDDSTTETNQVINARLRGQGRKPSAGKPLFTKDDEATFEEELDIIRARCWTMRRFAPARSSCGFCGKLFEADAHTGGPNDLSGKAEERAWEERMEHLGRHYERDGCLPSMEGADQDLLEWGLNEGILAEVDSVGAWLVGYDLPTTGNDHLEIDSGEIKREGLRRRGPRRKASNPVAIRDVDDIVKFEGTPLRSVKKEEEEDSDIDAMAEDD